MKPAPTVREAIGEALKRAFPPPPPPPELEALLRRIGEKR